MTSSARKSILFLCVALSALLSGSLSRPSNRNSRRCPTSEEPDLRGLVAAEKRRLIDRIGRSTRLDFGADLPEPPAMLTKLAKKRKASLGKRSLPGNGGGNWEYSVAESTETIYVLGRHLTRGTTRTNACFTPTMAVASCVEFSVNETIGDGDSLERVSLWMYYQIPSSHLESNAAANRSLEVYEVIRPTAGHSDVRNELVAVIPTLPGTEKGWVEADISGAFYGQATSLRRNRILRIQWRGPTRSALPPVSWENSKDTPFLEIVVKKARGDNEVSTESAHLTQDGGRVKRHTTYASTSHHCSIRHFYVNFTDFGWDSWIIAPSGYAAGYCAGACSHRSRTEGLNGLLRDHLSSAPPCCAPARRMNPLQIVYADRSNGDENVVYRTLVLANMTVTHCACR